MAPMNSWIITADLHLSDKPQDSYRWGIFDWLRKQQDENKISGCLILGDLTEEKDCHSATLVNKMVNGLRKLEPPVYILKGNHDYIDYNNPYFGFLSCIDGIRFITTPAEIEPGIFAIPHQPNQKAFDAACVGINPDHMVLLHGLFDGALA